MPAYFRGLAENGFFADRNVAIEYRRTEVTNACLTTMAEDLVRRDVIVITTVGGGDGRILIEISPGPLSASPLCRWVPIQNFGFDFAWFS